MLERDLDIYGRVDLTKVTVVLPSDSQRQVDNFAAQVEGDNKDDDVEELSRSTSTGERSMLAPALIVDERLIKTPAGSATRPRTTS